MSLHYPPGKNFYLSVALGPDVGHAVAHGLVGEDLPQVHVLAGGLGADVVLPQVLVLAGGHAEVPGSGVIELRSTGS